MKKYYLAVTPDKYELPIYVAESPSEMAEVLGIKYKSVLQVISKSRGGKHSGMKLIRIEVDERENDEDE